MSGALLAVGLVVTIVATVVITVWVRRTLKKELDRYAPVSEEEEDEDAIVQLDGIDVSSDEDDGASLSTALDASDLHHSYALEGGQTTAGMSAKQVEDEEKQGPTVEALASAGESSELELSTIVPTAAMSVSAPSTSSSTSSSSAPSSVVVSPITVQRRVVSRHSSPSTGPVQQPSPLASPVTHPLSSPHGVQSSALLPRVSAPAAWTATRVAVAAAAAAVSCWRVTS